MESRLGYNFGNIRIHTDDRASRSAQSVNARAYTVANHVVIGEGEYSPNTEDGKKLLLHEAVHVLQQMHSSTFPSKIYRQVPVRHGIPGTSSSFDTPGTMTSKGGKWKGNIKRERLPSKPRWAKVEDGRKLMSGYSSNRC